MSEELNIEIDHFLVVCAGKHCHEFIKTKEIGFIDLYCPKCLENKRYSYRHAFRYSYLNVSTKG